MSGFLLDTNVISMVSPSRAEASKQFIEWLEQMDEEGKIFLSVITLHEIEKGIALLEYRGSVVKAAGLRVWLSGLISSYEDKILSFDATAALLAGQLEAKAISVGHDPGMADAAIAGLAKANDLTLITCNIKHFLPFGIGLCSPDEVTY